MRKSEQIQLEKDIKVIDQARRIINKWRSRYLKMNERLSSQDFWCAHLKRNEREMVELEEAIEALGIVATDDDYAKITIDRRLPHIVEFDAIS